MSDGITRVSHDGFGNFVEPAENNTTPPTGPAPTPAPTFNADAGRVVRTTTHEDGGVQVDSSGVTQLNSNELNAGGTGLLASAVNNCGRPVSGKEVSPDSIVNFNGMTMTVRGAVGVGLLKVSESGNYAETSDAERNAPTEAPAEDIGREGFTNPEHEAALTTIVTTLPEPLQHRLVSHFILNKPMTETDVDDYATAAGQSPEAFLRNVHAAFTGFQNQAEAVERAAGITSAEDRASLHAWLATQPEAVNRAKSAMAYSRSMGEYRALVDNWYRQTPPNEAALRAAGFKLSKSGAGKTLVTIAGIQVLLEVAAKQGMI